MTDLTQEQAIAVYETKWWETATDDEIVKFQLFTKRLCMPFDKFHGAVGRVLKRPVWTHEFGSAGRLKEEYLGEKPAPSFEQIMDIIPKENRIIVVIGKEEVIASPTQQTQEHCLCEGVCPSYIISQEELKLKYRGSPCSDNFRTKNCKYDTRSDLQPQEGIYTFMDCPDTHYSEYFKKQICDSDGTNGVLCEYICKSKQCPRGYAL